MGVVHELAAARSDYERGEWTAAFAAWEGVGEAALTADDLVGVATVAHLLGERERSVAALQRAFHRCADDDPAAAVRCAFRLARTFFAAGEQALFAGWLARAERLLQQLPRGPGGEDPVEHGYVALLQMFRALATGEFAVVGERAAEATALARRHGDAELLALGLCAQGRMALLGGRVAEGLALIDEAMVGVVAGELGPVVAGEVYCTAIEGCQEIGAVDRVVEWTSGLTRWCAAQPGLVAFTGQCAVHRGQILVLRGAWEEAVAEFTDAATRYERTGQEVAVGLADQERGAVLRWRGELDAAEAAYQSAASRGCDPQPGLALLWLARGRTTAAVAAVRRALTEAAVPPARARLLPAAVEVLLAADALDEARERVADLDELAADFGTEPMRAAAAHAHAALEIAAGDAAGALPYARKALQCWGGVDCPFEVARVRTVIGRALAALGDEASSRQELAAAREAFVALGAAPWVVEVGRLLSQTSLPGGLTARELDVLRLVAAGRSNSQIAAELVLSPKTVARHLSNIFAKLDVGSRTAAAAYAFKHDLA